MLRSNSKKAIENIKNYVMEGFTPEGYGFTGNIENFEEVAPFILDTFHHEKVKYDKRKLSHFQLFAEWCSGLPSILDTCYYYNRSAVDDLAMILEESEEEKNRFTEAEAEARLTYLIYRELMKHF